jgi:hypothetical protein
MFTRYLQAHSLTKEYVIYVQRLVGFARHFRGLPLDPKDPEEVDLTDGGLLDHHAMIACLTFLQTSVRPKPLPATVRKHVEALEQAAQWRKSASDNLTVLTTIRSNYETVTELVRRDSRAVRKQEKKRAFEQVGLCVACVVGAKGLLASFQNQPTQNLIPVREAQGKHVSAETVLEALDHCIETFWNPKVQEARENKEAAKSITFFGETNTLQRPTWCRIIGTLVCAFYCHHPNRPQALMQVTLGKFKAFVEHGTPMPFHGKTELSTGPQTLIFEPFMRKLAEEYLECFRPATGADTDPEAPLLVTFGGNALPNGGPSECLRIFFEFEKHIVGDGVRITPTDLFKVCLLACSFCVPLNACLCRSWRITSARPTQTPCRTSSNSAVLRCKRSSATTDWRTQTTSQRLATARISNYMPGCAEGRQTRN